MASPFNLFDFSSLGGVSSIVKPPVQVSGATGGGMMPPTTTAQPLPQTPVQQSTQIPASQQSSEMPTDDELKQLIADGYTDEQIIEAFKPKVQPKEEQGVISGALQKTGEGFMSGISKIGQAGEDLASGKIGYASAAVRGGAGALESFLSPVTGVIGQGLEEGFKALPETTQKNIKETTVPIIQKAQEFYAKESPQQQERLKDIMAATDILTTLVGGKAVQQAGKQTVKATEKAGIIATKQLEKVPTKISTKLAQKGEDFLYEAVNPTTRENKAILRQRVEDLVPYIENNPAKNSLEQVKSRIDIDKNNALDNMKLYEERVGVKGTVETAPIKKKLEDEFIKKVKGVVINEDDAKIAKEMIAKLDELGAVIKDEDIITLRRAWDDVIAKNKGFMMTADAKTKGDVFNTVNKILREEIRKSNPEYAKMLEQAHKTMTLSDVIEATILRRAGQQKGGFIRRGFENVARITGATGGGIPGYLASEALIQAGEAVSSSAAKLTAGKLLYKKTKNGIRSNVSGIVNNNVPKMREGLKKPLINLAEEKAKVKSNPLTNGKIIKKSTTPEVQGDGGKFNPLDLSKNKKGSLNIGQIGKDLGIINKPKVIEGIGKKVPDELKGLAEEAKKYKSAEEFMRNIHGDIKGINPSNEYKGHSEGIIYHGTTESASNNITNQGFNPSISRTGKSKGAGFNYISFSDSPAHAERFGWGRGENPDVLAIAKNKYKFMNIDNDFINKFGNNELKWTTNDVKKYVNSKGYDGINFKAKDGNFNEYRLFNKIAPNEIVSLKKLWNKVKTPE